MDFKNSFKKGLFRITNPDFNEKALELFNFQARNNPIYKRYIKLRRIDPSRVTSCKEIPFLPITFFKNYKISTGKDKAEFIFKSSGTTGQVRSRHFISDLSFYEKVSVEIFKRFYGDLQDYTIKAFLPSYLENKNSSLIYMVNKFIDLTQSEESGFISSDPKLLSSELRKLRDSKKTTVLIGVTYALLDLAIKMKMDLSRVIIMETGGMKGRGEEKIRSDVHSTLKSSFNVEQIHSEYGMTELLSQAYSKVEGIYKSAPWMRVLTREINDPFEINNQLNSGGINIIDLANVDSCAFIETQDIGKVIDEESFQILGRYDNSDIRGCNLLYYTN